MTQHQKRLLLVVGLSTILVLLSACGKPTETQMDEEWITIEGVQVVAGSHIEFRGSSTLPDGTCLHTQLSADGTPVNWWPAEKCVEVEKGEWQVRVHLGENGVPQELSSETQYVLTIWERDHPSVEAQPFWFDLSGPQEPSE